MPLFGHARDISLFRRMNRELINKIIEQQIGYYQIDLNKTTSDLYGESDEKFYLDPVLINCLLERGDTEFKTGEGRIDNDRIITVRLLRDDMVPINLVPQVGDIILWNEDYYEVDNYNENQLIVGKDPSYAYDEIINRFGSSWSILLRCHYVRPEKLGIVKTGQ